MSSIFIWKSQTPNNSKKTIRYYSGSNWALEDNDYSSKSYSYLEQSVFSNLEYFNSAIVYNIKIMPNDWVGSELLEVTQLSYQLIKEDAYGLLENIGEWMKFTLKKDIVFERDVLEQELGRIKDWINAAEVSHTHHRSQIQTNQTHTPTMYRQNYNNKQPHRYQQPPHPQQNRQNQQNYHQPRHKQPLGLNREEIKHNFQHFLDKYTLQSMQSNCSQVESTYINNVYNEGRPCVKEYNNYNKYY